MADLRDFTGKNRKFTGTIGERISTGTTGERDVATFGAGTLRFNSSTNLLEYYTGVLWKSIDAPPTITAFNINSLGNVTSAVLPSTSSILSIEIIGSLFSSGCTVQFLGNGGGDVSPLTTTFNSASSVTVTVNSNSFNAAYEPFDLKVSNVSGLSAQLDNCINVDAVPVFATAAGTLGTIGDSARSSYSLSPATATDADGNTITYSLTSGSLPTGLSLNSSTGAISGTASAVGSNTTSTFTITASTTVLGITVTSSRQFSITVNAPVIESFTTAGSFTFNVPVGVSSVRVLAVAGGGGGGGNIAGGGGAGGMVEHSTFPVTPGGTVTGSVGSGGPGGQARNSGGVNSRGQNTTFGAITAIGGGGGGAGGSSVEGPADVQGGAPGGSGGGQNGYPDSNGSPGTATQGPSGGGTGFGNPGGSGKTNHGSGGGGGAGGGGQPSPGPSASGAGGVGRQNDINGTNYYWAGGGGGANYDSGRTSGNGGLGGGGGGGIMPGSTAGTGGGSALNSGANGLVVPSATTSASGGAGGLNTGGGGGGGTHDQTAGGAGGRGIVVVRY